MRDLEYCVKSMNKCSITLAFIVIKMTTKCIKVEAEVGLFLGHFNTYGSFVVANVRGTVVKPGFQVIV